jgi:hypothetical protein
VTLSPHVWQNGPEINLPISRAQRTFGPGRLQRIYCYTWRRCNRLLDRHQVFTSEEIYLYSCWTTKESATIVIDQAILDAINHYPFSSIWELARLTCIPTTTIHRHLTQSLGFVVKHIHWIPDTPHGYSKNGVCHSLNWTVAPASIHRRPRLAVHYHPWRVIVLSFDRPWADLASRRKTMPWKTEAYHPRPKNNGDHCMKSTGISFTRCASKRQHI